MNPDTDSKTPKFLVPAPSTGDLGLVDSPRDAAMDRITQLTTRLLNTPVALVSIVEEGEDRQYFTSQQGLAEPWRTLCETPLSHSFCQYVKKSGEPLIVSDARLDDLLKNNLAIRDLDVVAYIGVPIHNSEQQPIGALCAIDSQPRDWTEQEHQDLKMFAEMVDGEILLRTEEYVKTTREQQLDLVLQASGDWFWDWEIETPESFTACCGADFLPIDGAMANIKSLEDFLSSIRSIQRNRVRTAIEAHLENGHAFQEQVQMCHQSGRWVDVSLRGQAAWDSSGQPVRMVCSVSDVSKLVESTALLSRSERHAKIGHWQYFPQSDELLWSAEVYRIHGLERLEFEPTIDAVKKLYNEEDWSHGEELANASYKDKRPFKFDARITTRKGERRIVEIFADTISDSAGEVVFITGTLRDITGERISQKKTDETSRMNAFQQLAGGVSHDINNVLATVMGSMELLQEERDLKEKSFLIDVGMEALERGRELTARLQSFSQTAPLRPEVISILDSGAKIQGLLDEILSETQGSSIQISGDVKKIRVDPTGFTKSLKTIFTNASEAIDVAGSIAVSIENFQATEEMAGELSNLKPGEYVCVRISDDGVGMPNSIMNRAFEPFFTTKNVANGAGLGLSSLQGFLEQSEGCVTIESKLGVGTSVSLYFPACDAGS